MELTDRIGYYIGSFDPPTLAHRAAVIEAMKHFGLAKVYITVNHCTDKDFNASMAERILMLQILFADQGDRIVILREPLEGRRDFARYILGKHPGQHVLGIFGDDTFEKNFRIFNGEPRFDFVRIARPVVCTESASEAYVPKIYDIILHDADGLSSSEARRRVALGLDTSKVLLPDVARLIAHGGLYANIEGDALQAAERSFLARWRSFRCRLQGVIGEKERKALAVPSFKPSQSREGQSDKFVRHVIDSLGTSLDEQFRLRPAMERLLGIRYPTHPITWRAGVYLGSFEPTPFNDAQAEVARAALEQGSLNRLTVGVLESSPRKVLKLSVAARMRLARKLFGRFGDSVCVVKAPGLDQSAPFVKQLRDEQLEPLLAVFGANVFTANLERFGSLDNMRFAVAPMDNVEMPKLPEGSLALDLKRAG